MLCLSPLGASCTFESSSAGGDMNIEVARNTALVKFGTRFAPAEAERLYDVAQSLAPHSQLTVDFTEIRDFHDSAFILLAKALGARPGFKIVLRGLTIHQSRMLAYFGFGQGGNAARRTGDIGSKRALAH